MSASARLAPMIINHAFAYHEWLVCSGVVWETHQVPLCYCRRDGVDWMDPLQKNILMSS